MQSTFWVSCLSEADKYCVLTRRPSSLLAAILRVPFVDLLTTMTRPELPLTVHEYEEWGNPADPTALQLVSPTNHHEHSLVVFNLA